MPSPTSSPSRLCSPPGHLLFLPLALLLSSLPLLRKTVANSGNVLHPKPPLSSAFSIHRIFSRCSVLCWVQGLSWGLPRVGLRMSSPSRLLAAPFCGPFLPVLPTLSSPDLRLSSLPPLSPLLRPQFRFRFKYHLLSFSEKWRLDLHLEETVFQESVFLSSASSTVSRVLLLDKVCDLGM